MLDDAQDNEVEINEPELSLIKQDSICCTPPVSSAETHEYLGKTHLDHISEKLQNKVQALKALKGM